MSIEDLKLHLAVARTIRPVISNEASQIFRAYYQKILSPASTSTGRTTTRVLGSFYRVATGYSRLLLKQNVSALDAVVVIRVLMESSYGLGRIVMQPYDATKKTAPLGPTEAEVKELLRGIGMFHLMPNVLAELQDAEQTSSSNYFQVDPAQRNQQQGDGNTDSMWQPFSKKQDLAFETQVAAVKRVAAPESVLNVSQISQLLRAPTINTLSFNPHIEQSPTSQTIPMPQPFTYSPSLQTIPSKELENMTQEQLLAIIFSDEESEPTN